MCVYVYALDLQLGIPLLLLFHLSLMLTSNSLNFHGLHIRVLPLPLLLDPLTVCLQHQPPALLDQGYRNQDDSPAKVPRHELIFGFFGGKQAYLKNNTNLCTSAHLHLQGYLFGLKHKPIL